MSTRSATNKRTQFHEVTGVARKSAASAKPARQAASSVRVVPASSKARRKELEKGENLEGLSKEEKRARKQRPRVSSYRDLGDFIYDFARIRPLRNMYRAQAEGMSENKLNALIERAAAEEDKKDSKKK